MKIPLSPSFPWLSKTNSSVKLCLIYLHNSGSFACGVPWSVGCRHEDVSNVRFNTNPLVDYLTTRLQSVGWIFQAGCLTTLSAQRLSEMFEETSHWVPYYLPQITTGPDLGSNRTVAVGIRRLTLWAMTQKNKEKRFGIKLSWPHRNINLDIASSDRKQEIS